MAYKNLREFVKRLEKSGELQRISVPVDPHLEITEITDRISKGPQEQNKALFFEDVKGSAMPVLINSMGGAQRMAWALGVDELEDLNQNLAKLIDLRLPQGFGAPLGRAGEMFGALRSVGLKPRVVNNAPVQEIMKTGEEATLDGIPILTCWPDDGGPYITLPTVITRDPVTGGRNVGMYRLQVYDERTLGMHWQLHKGGAEHERLAREKGGEKIPVAVSIGGDPAVIWSGSAPLPPGIDEFLLAG